MDGKTIISDHNTSEWRQLDIWEFLYRFRNYLLDPHRGTGTMKVRRDAECVDERGIGEIENSHV